MSAQREAQAIDCQVLPLEATHLPAVISIERRAYPFPWTEAIFRDCLKAGYHGWVLFDVTRQVRGYALLSMAAGEAHVLNVCVDPDYRGRGFGRFLMQHLLGVAVRAGMTVVLLEVRTSNHVALQLYRSLGFARIGVRRGYYPAAGGREDAHVLALELV